MDRQRIADSNQLVNGQAVKFEFRRKGRPQGGFVIRFQNEIVAYENVCRHIPISLDYGDGQFFTRDGKHLICQSHGATYEPLTGECIAGPCTGDKLKPLPVLEENGIIWLVLEST